MSMSDVTTLSRGLLSSWDGVEIQEHTKTKKFKSYRTPFSSLQGSIDAFKALFEQYKDSIIVVSYSSNALPDKETLFNLLASVKDHITVYPIDHRYSFGTQRWDAKNVVKEYLFVGK